MIAHRRCNTLGNGRNYRPVMWALLLGILLLTIPTASATTVIDELTDNYDDPREYLAPPSGGLTTTSGFGTLNLWVHNIADTKGLHVVYCNFAPRNFNYYSPESWAAYEARDYPVTYKIGGTVIGHGYFAYNLLRDASGTVQRIQMWTTVSEWDISGLEGSQLVYLVFEDGCPVASLPVEYTKSGSPTANESILFASYHSYWRINEGYYGEHIVRMSYDWENTVESSENTVKLIRGGDWSSIVVQTSTGNVTKSGITDEELAVWPPYTWIVTNGRGTVFSGPSSDVGSGSSAVNIYVRDSQTGSLLPNTHVTVLDSHAGSVPVVNQTLPTGTGTFELEKADYLKYHASATADGYTLLSPIIFGVPEGGTTIALWMSPNASPDEPIEEGKSMLYGYVQTQGSQQPISGATVALDGYGSTTTSSTGFYMFNNVTPGTYDISASAPLHDALSEPVTVDAAPTQHNLALKGHFLLTVTIKDGDTLANLHNATISLSDGQESTQNPATFNVDYGPYTITAAAGGYYPQTQSAYLDKPGTTTATVLLTAKPEPVPPPEMPNYPPHNVKFTIQTLLGTPIPGVTVTAQGIQQTPSTNILERLLGLNMTSTPINSESMSGTTDTNGEINFMMIEAVKYRISLYKPDVVNQTLEIYPKEDTYPIIISTAGGPLLPDAGDALRDIRINVTTSTEGDTGHIHIDYNDTTRKTTGLTIQVTQQYTTDPSAPEEVIASHTVANDANVTHTFDLSVYKGQSFFVRLEAEHPDFGTVHRDYAVAFKGVRVPLGPLPDGLYIYVAGFGLMLLGGIFGATSATRGVVVIALAGWLFYAFGWLDDLGLIAPVSLGLVSTLAVMGVIVTRYREEGYQ